MITPYWQSNFEPQVDARVIIRVDGDPHHTLEPLRRVVTAVDPRVPVRETISMEDQMRARFTEVRLGGAVLIAGATPRAVVIMSLVGAPMISRWLFAIEPFDLPATAVAVLAVGLVALLASYFPARRASRTDPAAVFRAD